MEKIMKYAKWHRTAILIQVIIVCITVIPAVILGIVIGIYALTTEEFWVVGGFVIIIGGILAFYVSLVLIPALFKIIFLVKSKKLVKFDILSDNSEGEIDYNLFFLYLNVYKKYAVIALITSILFSLPNIYFGSSMVAQIFTYSTADYTEEILNMLYSLICGLVIYIIIYYPLFKLLFSKRIKNTIRELMTKEFL